MEEKISKHTIKILKTIRDPSRSLSKKIKEIILEICIITFAIALSQFLEKEREHAVKQKEVSEFLQGLKYDIISDIDQAKVNIKSYDRLKIVFTYLSASAG